MTTNHPEGLFHRPHSKYWWMSFYQYDTAKGKRVKVHKSTGQTSQKKAKAVRVTTVKAVSDGKQPPQSVERIRFEDLVRGLRASYKTKGNKSLDRALLAVDHLEGTFAGNRAIDLTASRISDYMLDRMDADAARATVYYELSILKRMLRIAWRRGDLHAVPLFPEMGELHNEREGFFTDADVALLQVELPEYIRGLAMFAYLTSWRKQEMLGLTWDHVDFGDGVVWLGARRTKGKESRTFPFKDFPALLAVLEGQRDYAELWERRTGRIVTHVFTNHGKPIKNYYAAWRSACKRAGLEGRYMHDNRRSAVRNMDRAGIPRDIAKKLSGHKTDSMYSRYNIVDERDLNDATAKLGQREEVEAKLAES